MADPQERKRPWLQRDWLDVAICLAAFWAALRLPDEREVVFALLCVAMLGKIQSQVAELRRALDE